MAARNLPYQLVSETATLFGWPESTLFGTSLKKELGHAKRVIIQHSRRLFGEHYHLAVEQKNKEIKKHLEEKACDDLIAILQTAKKDKFYGTRFITVSMLDTFICAKEREGYHRKLKKGRMDDILKKFA